MNSIVSNIKRVLGGEASIEDLEREVSTALSARAAAESKYAADPTDANGDAVISARRAHELALVREHAARDKKAREDAERKRLEREKVIAEKRKRFDRLVSELTLELSSVERGPGHFKNVGKTGAIIADLADLAMRFRARKREAEAVADRMGKLSEEARALRDELVLDDSVPPGSNVEEIRIASLKVQFDRFMREGFGVADLRNEEDLLKWLDLNTVSRAT